MQIHLAVKGKGTEREVWENLAEFFAGAMTLQDRREHIAIVGRHRQIARTFEYFAAQARPFSQDAPALNAATHHKHHAAPAVIGAERRVLLYTSAEFRHHDE